MKFSETIAKLSTESTEATIKAPVAKGKAWKLDKKEDARPNMVAYIRRGANKPKIVLGKITKVYPTKGIEYTAAGTFMAEWKDVIDVFDFKDKDVSKDLPLALKVLREIFPHVRISS